MKAYSGPAEGSQGDDCTESCCVCPLILVSACPWTPPLQYCPVTLRRDTVPMLFLSRDFYQGHLQNLCPSGLLAAMQNAVKVQCDMCEVKYVQSNTCIRCHGKDERECLIWTCRSSEIFEHSSRKAGENSMLGLSQCFSVNDCMGVSGRWG